MTADNGDTRPRNGLNGPIVLMVLRKDNRTLGEKGPYILLAHLRFTIKITKQHTQQHQWTLA